MEPRVFIVQNQHRWDKGACAFLPKFDLSSAAKYGTPVHLLGPSAAPFRPGSVVQEMQEKLRDFCDNDYLLLIGNPVLIGIAFAIAADANEGTVRALQWNGREGCYIPVEVPGVFPRRAGQEDNGIVGA